MPMRALIDVFSMIDEGLAKLGSSDCTRKNGPLTLTAKERSKPASSHFQWAAIADTRVDEQYIEPAECLAHGRGDRGLTGNVAGVRADGQNVAA